MNNILTEEFLRKYQNKQPNWGFNGLGYIVYSRTYSRQKQDGTNEQWWETVARCVNGSQEIGAGYTIEEAQKLYDYIFNLKCSFAGRMLWMLGTEHVKKWGGNALCNCFFVSIVEPEDFCFLFENLMLGGGVGFSIKREDVHELPKIKENIKIEHQNTKDADFIVPDSRQGWVALLRRILKSYFMTGRSFNYSTMLVRGYGEKIHGLGGTASGAGILVDGITQICKIFESREGKKLRSIDCLDICNIIGGIVVSGNLRRSAQIALGDPDDYLFLRAKRWDLGNIPNWRSNSNNTIYCDDFTHIQNDVWEGYLGNGEPYGLFNLPLCRKYGRLGEVKKDLVDGVNPCQPKWAKLLTKEGIKKLEDINIGDFIWSKEGWTKVINKWSTGIKKVNAYYTNSGIFYGTENHKVFSQGIKDEIKNIDSIDIITGEFNKNIEFNNEEIMDGLVLGDGSVHKASNNLVYLIIGEKDQDYFNSEIKNLILKYRPGLHDKAYEIKTSIISEELPKTFNRKIPERYFYGNKSRICSFLRGLYSANGCCNNVGRICLKATSFDIIKDVQIMLNSLGIRSYYTTGEPTQVTFSNGTYICKTSYDLNITSDRDKFMKLIGFIQEYKNESYYNFIKNHESTNKPKINYDITKIEFISEEEVFDITVDNTTHSYWTEGCDVSNCAELPLPSGGICCLSDIFLNNISSKEELIECAKLLYKTQKAVCSLNYLHEKTSKVVRRDYRIGIGVTGACQSLDKLEWLDDCYKEVRKLDKEWSKLKNLPESIRITTIKPSGTLSLLSGSTPGVHPAFAKYYIRRVRMSSNDKLIDQCSKLGYKVEYVKGYDGEIDYKTKIVEFPCFVGENTIIAKDMTAIQQLELVKKMQTIWADSAISVTVYYKKEELPDIKKWLKEHYTNSIKSVSFLLHKDNGFKQQPYEEITKEQYEELISKVKPLNTLIVGYGDLENLECSSGACPIK